MRPFERLRLRSQFRRRLRLPRIRSIISPADLFTLTNALAGFLAIVTLASDPAVEAFGKYDDVLFAAVLIGIGMLADALDGIVARKWGSSSLGGDLDTLADATTFVIAPAFLVVHVYGRAEKAGFLEDQLGFPTRAVLVAGLVVLMGLLRLARFNSNPVEGENTTFQGLPTPGCAAGIVVVVLAGVPTQWALAAIALLALLMMSNVAYPKSRGSIVKVALGMVAAGAFIIGGILLIPERQNFFIRLAFALASLVIAVSPFLLRIRQAREARRERDG